LLEAAAARGLGIAVVAEAAFAGSALTDAAYGQVPYRGVAPGEATVEAVATELAAGTRLVYAYHAALDTIGHRSGMASRRWRGEARRVARLIEMLAARLPVGAAMFVTADHGMLDVPMTGRIDIDADARLSAGVRVIGGEPRVRYLHTRDGARDDVHAAWREVLGTRADVYPREQLIESGWFGPVAAAHVERIGDLVVVCGSDIAVLAGNHEPHEVARLVGLHGSVTDAERLVPLWVLQR
jgi:hypothetical protein